MTIQPWERLEDESNPAWEAFMHYRDLGLGRSLARVASALGKSTTLIERWSARDGWIARCEAWDREQDRLWHLQQQQSRKEMSDRHVKVARAFMGKVVKRLNDLKPEELSPKDLSTWLETAAKVERLALGEPTRHEISGNISIEHGLSDEERHARLEAIQQEITRRIKTTPTRLAITAGDDSGATVS
jgi:hypothetical protein